MAAKKRGFITYRSYSFREKDPVIDLYRTKRSESGLSYGQVAERGGASATTQRAWEHGTTRKPQFCTVSASFLAIGIKGIVFRNGKPYLID